MSRLSALLLLVALVVALFNPTSATSPLRQRLHTPSTPASHSTPSTPSTLPYLELSALPLAPHLQATVPFLGLFSNPSSLAPGATVTLSWACYFCSNVPANTVVTISSNRSVVVMRNASLNGSTTYTVPTAFVAGQTITFTANSSATALPSYELDLPLHAPSPKVTLLAPAYDQKLSQAKGITVSWTCAECYIPPTVTVTWITASTPTKSGTLANHVPVPDSGLTLPIPDDLVAASAAYIRVTYDGLNTVYDQTYVTITE